MTMPYDFSKYAVSDAGPKARVMVYQCVTGIVVWMAPWWMPHKWALKKANHIVHELHSTNE